MIAVLPEDVFVGDAGDPLPLEGVHRFTARKICHAELVPLAADS
jgi:hypothetical protein